MDGRDRMTYEVRSYRPPWWLPNPHAQTIGGKLLRSRRRPPLERHRLETPDGDFLDVDIGAEPVPGAPVAIVLHGLEGSMERSYARLMLSQLFARGIRPVGLNFRACSGEPNRMPRFYHSGDTGDLAFVVEYVTGRFPERRIGAVGFSLGGNVLLKFLGERGTESPLRAAAAISVPFDLAAAADRLSKGFMSRTYTHYFLRSLQAKIRAKDGRMNGEIDTRLALTATSLREYDDVATAPLHGFASADDYYARCSSRVFLHRIEVPTLLLQSRDDPFLPREALPEAEIDANPCLVKAFVDQGGHVGFIGGTVPWRPTSWAEPEAARFLAHHLGDGAS